MPNAWEEITSRHNALLVETHKLSDRKHRTRTGLFRFDGVKLAVEAIARDVEIVAILLRASDAERVAERIFTMSKKRFPEGARVACVADAVFDGLTEESAPEGILCVARMGSPHGGQELSVQARERVVLLESVRDPSNLGAIIRSAAAFGVHRLVLSSDCADIYNAKTVRASMGTLFSQRIDRVDDLTEAVALLKRQGRRVFAAALDASAQRLGSFDPLLSDCVVIGNEGHGLSTRMIKACGESIYIPMTEHAESLNAAVAASVLMWDFYRLAVGEKSGGERA